MFDDAGLVTGIGNTSGATEPVWVTVSVKSTVRPHAALLGSVNVNGDGVARARRAARFGYERDRRLT